MPWLCDNMSDDLKKALGGLNNPEFVFDPEGKIVRLRDWSSPKDLRADLEKLVGPVSNPTEVADLNLKTNQSKAAAARGVVPRLKIADRMRPVKAAAKGGVEEAEPYYAKLRAEADENLLTTGSGRLYLGFFLDPLYEVHWNNLVASIEFEIKVPEGTSATPSTGKGPKVKAEGDIDPREFLVEIEGGDVQKPLELTVRYFACNDEEGWCKKVEQSYSITLERDRHAGVVRAREWGGGGPGRDRGGRPPGRGGPPVGGGPPGGFSVERLFRFDEDEDGRISKEELPDFLRERILGRLDTNKDGFIDKAEAETRGR